MKISAEEVKVLYQPRQIDREKTGIQTNGVSLEKSQQKTSIRIEKVKALSKVEIHSSLKEDEAFDTILIDVKELMKNKDLRGLIDRDYLQANQENFYGNLSDNEVNITINEETSRENIEKKLKTTLNSLGEEGKNKILTNKLKELLATVDKFPEEKKVSLYKTILLEGFLMNMDKE